MHIPSLNSFFKSQKLTTLFFCCLFFLSISFASYSATFQVTNLNDNGRGSFRQAVLDANANIGFDDIIFKVRGLIRLKNSIQITEPVLIDGLTAPNSTPSSPSVALEYLYTSIYIQNAKDVILRGIQIINPSSQPVYEGVIVENSTNVLIENMVIHFRKSAILGLNVRDIQIRDNDLRDSGFDLGTSNNDKGAAIKLQTVSANNFVGGVRIFGNQVGVYRHEPTQVLRIEEADKITVSGSNPNANILMNNSQLGVSNPFYFSNINNLVINRIESISNTYPNGHVGVAFEINDSEMIAITQNVVLGREIAVKTNTTTDLIINKNNFKDCGGIVSGRTLTLENVKANRLTGGLHIRGNEFGKDRYYSFGVLSLKGAKNITISNPSNTQANISLNNSGLNSPFPVRLENVENVVIEDIDLSFSPSEYGVNNGIAIDLSNCIEVYVANNIVKKRWMAIRANYITDLYIVKNDFVDSGLEGLGGNINPAIHLNSISEGNLSRGLFIADNRFGKDELNPKRILYLYPTEQTYITNPNLGGNIQLNESGLDLDNALLLISNNHIEVKGLEFKREDKKEGTCAIEVQRYVPLWNIEINIYNNSFLGWDRAIKISDVSQSYNYIGCNNFVENQIGVEVTNSVISLQHNSFIGNRYATVNNGNLAFYASRNYWGASNGSSTDGGSGDAYKGDVLGTRTILGTPSNCAPQFNIPFESEENAVAENNILRRKINSNPTEHKNKIQIYPNPTNGIVNFELPIFESSRNEQIQIRIIDALGRVINTTDYQPHSTLKIDLTNQKAGIYLVEILIGTERYTQKLIKE